jgi:cytochrome c peroxidase
MPGARRGRTFARALLSGVAAAIVASTAQAEAPDVPASLTAPFVRPSEALPALPDNPTTDAKVRLGWALFQDRRLSRDRSLACVDCHQPERDWQDGRARALGPDGTTLRRRTAPLYDVAWGRHFFRDGRARSLEEQALIPIEAHDEMNQSIADVVTRLQRIGFYQGLFADAFPEEPVASARTITFAIAAFERTIVSGTTPFDRWVAGEDEAIGAAAQRGFALFAGKANCAACHTTWRLTDDDFHDTGLPDSGDRGRGAVTGRRQDDHAFRTPSLRNAARRTPYMHDGSLPTLRAVVDHYADGLVARPTLSARLRRVALSEAERADLVAFLESLSDDRPPDPGWSPFR